MLSLLLIISSETFAPGQGRENDENSQNLSHQNFRKAVSLLLKMTLRFVSSFTPIVSASELLRETRSPVKESGCAVGLGA